MCVTSDNFMIFERINFSSNPILLYSINFISVGFSFLRRSSGLHILTRQTLISWVLTRLRITDEKNLHLHVIQRYDSNDDASPYNEYEMTAF